MMLTHKNAVIYGAGGSLGSAVARAFARQGAKVFVSGRTLAPVTRLANDIVRDGGAAEAAQVDALDERAVNAFVDRVRARAGSVDISFNLIGLQDIQDVALVKMSIADFVRPIEVAMRSHFLTATAAGRAMVAQGSGVILALTATPGGIGYPMVGGFGPACCAIEGLVRDLASELGAHGVRVVNLRSAGSPDSRVFQEAVESGGDDAKQFLTKLESDTMLKALPRVADIGNVAAFLASELAGKITGVTIDVTAGTTAALNYMVPRIPLTDRWH